MVTLSEVLLCLFDISTLCFIQRSQLSKKISSSSLFVVTVPKQVKSSSTKHNHRNSASPTYSSCCDFTKSSKPSSHTMGATSKCNVQTFLLSFSSLTNLCLSFYASSTNYAPNYMAKNHSSPSPKVLECWNNFF